MKFTFTIVIVLLSLIVIGQNTNSDLNLENPRTELENARAEYNKALKEKNSPLLIKFLMLQLAYQKEIDKDSVYPMINEIEEYIKKSEDVVEKAILHSIIADLYYGFDFTPITREPAAPITGYVPKNMKEWTGNIFINKVFEHAWKAIENKEVLEKIDKNIYKDIILESDVTNSLNQSLYDILLIRSINALKGYSGRNSNRFYEQDHLESEKAFLPASDYIKLDIEVPENQFNLGIAKMYQLLITNAIDGKNENALIIYDLDRLRFFNYSYSNDDLFKQRLEEIINNYPNNPYCVEAVIELMNFGNFMFPNPFIDKDQHADEIQKNLHLGEDMVKRFKDYFRIDALKNKLALLKEPSLTFNGEQNVYPGENLKLRFHHRNISELNLTIYKINADGISYLREPEKTSRTKVMSKKIQLNNSFKSIDTVLYIPVKELGLYEIFVETEGLKSSLKKAIYSSSRLSSIARKVSPDVAEFLVCDIKSGKPVEGAEVFVYDRLFNEVGKGNTDEFGIAQIATDDETSHFIVKHKSDKYNLNYQVPYSILMSYFKSHEKSEREKLDFFTDRSVYRAGQNLHFKCIAWNESFDDKNTLIKYKQYDIDFYDSRNNLITTQKFTTNEYGSFAGSFVIPENVLGGHLYLRSAHGNHSVYVIDCKRPKFEIVFHPLEGEFRRGDVIRVKGQAKGYSGAKVNNCKVSYTIQENMFSASRSAKNSPTIAGTTYTNEKGEFLIDFETERKDSDSPFSRFTRYVITASITSPNGETQQVYHTVYLMDKSYSIQINPSSDIEKDGEMTIPISTYNTDNKPIQKNLKYNIFKVYTEHGKEPYAENVSIEKKILDGNVTTDKIKGTAEVKHDFSKWESGVYLIEVEGEDREDTVIQKSILKVFSKNDKKPPYNTYNWFQATKTKIAPKENAEILIGTSAKDVYILFEIHNKNKIMERKQLILSDESRLLTIPYLDAYDGEVEVSLSFMKDGQFFYNTTTIEKMHSDKTLNINTTTFRDKLKPGDEEEWTLTVKDNKGIGKLSELLVTMYDASLDFFRGTIWNLNSWSKGMNISTRWIEPTGGIFQYLHSENKPLKFPPFKYDDFNLYGLNQRDLDIFSIRGIDSRYLTGVPGTIMSGSQDVAFASINAKMGSAEDSNIFSYVGNSEIDDGIRENFQETAFFYPQLKTDVDGNVTFKFKVPDATTKWKVMALAHTQESYFGQFDTTVVTFKELMVQTNMPRFVRINDVVNILATINNLTDMAMEGDVYMELFNIETNNIIERYDQKFNISSNGNETVNFSFKVPDMNQPLGCRIVAKTPTHSDGEQHLIPIVSNSSLVAQTVSIFTNKAGEHTYKINVPKKGKFLRYTLEFTSNPLWYGVMAIPSVNAAQTENTTNLVANYYVSAVSRIIAVSNPDITDAIKNLSRNSENLNSELKKNQELKNISLQLTPWVKDAISQTERIKMLSELLDENRQNYIHTQAVQKLGNIQNPNGGWGWFKDHNSNLFMTLNVLEAMARIKDKGMETTPSERSMQQGAINYLDREIERNYKENRKGGSDELLYLYVRSSFKEIPLTNALAAHNHYMAYFEENWLQLGLYEKAIAALTFHGNGAKDLSIKIVNSLREYATTYEEMGMFWANNHTGYFRNSAVQTHVAIMNAFQKIDPKENEINNMRQWLLQHKHTHDWGNVPSTVDAIHGLLLSGTNWLGDLENLTIKLGKKDISSEIQDGIPGYIKYSVDGKEIKNTKSTSVTINKKTSNPTWGALFLQYFDNMGNLGANRSGISIKKELYLVKVQNDRTYQEPISEQKLKVGDRINVRMVVETTQDLEYVYLKDLRAGCFEPTSQLPSNQRKSNISYYQEITDSSANFFIENLPKGMHTFEYEVWISQSGNYQDGISTIQCIYAPEFTANSNAIKINVE